MHEFVTLAFHPKFSNVRGFSILSALLFRVSHGNLYNFTLGYDYLNNHVHVSYKCHMW